MGGRGAVYTDMYDDDDVFYGYVRDCIFVYVLSMDAGCLNDFEYDKIVVR